MTEILLFHHAQGLTTGVVALADRLRAAGHTVHTPDVYGGATFDTLDEGMSHARQIGFEHLLADSVEAAATRPADVAYVGISLGAMPAQQLAQTKPGARAVVLIGSAIPPEEFGSPWPTGLQLQIHATEEDPIFVGEGDIDAARELVETAGAELFLYPGGGHLFVDNSLPDYDESATEKVLERILLLLEGTS